MSEQKPHSRYELLAEKFLRGTITPQEEEEFNNWYQHLGEDDIVNIPGSHAASKETHRQLLWQDIEARTKQKSGSRRVAYIVRAAAVAAVLLLAGGIGWWQYSQIKSPAGIVTERKSVKDVQPGINAAILTLPGGKNIVLDAAVNGRLNESGTGADIVKSGNQVAVSANSSAIETAEVYHTLTTPRASQQKLVLADGTKVWLNAASSIRFPAAFTGTARNVEVTGEAYFEVASDAGKPFIVKLNDAYIRVLGTHFNVMAYPNEEAVQTTLLEGKVAFVKGKKNVTLAPGQQSSLTTAGNLTVVDNVDVEQVVAWRNGYQSFDNADIYTIMRQVERWYDVKVDIKGTLPARRFSGEIPRNASLSELLRLFNVTKIHFTIDASKKQLIVYP